MNKYQEALDKIVAASCPEHVACNNCNIQYVCNCDMKWYIDRLQELINNQPKTAKWINTPYTNERICSICEHKEPYKFADEDAKIYNFCPNCGAKMEN